MNTTDVGRTLVQWLENERSRLEIVRIQRKIEEDVIAFLKQRKLVKHVDPYSGLTLNLIAYNDDVIDKKELQYILKYSEYQRVFKKVPKEKLFILTPEQVEHMRQEMRKKTQLR